jgi:hypothetical protein
LQVDDASSKNEGYKEDTIGGVSVIDISGFWTLMIMTFFLMIVLTLTR